MKKAEEKTLSEANKSLLIEGAKLSAVLHDKGTALAKKNGYPGLTGLDALCRYFADKYHWTPTQVRQLSAEDLSLLLEDV